MTGRAAGYCAGYATPGYANPAGGRGCWGGRGAGRGWRNMFYATGLPGWMRFGAYRVPGVAPAPAQEADLLQAQAENLKATLANIEKRLEEIKGEAK